MANKFLYFGFGSNLLAKRILINNPTAVRRCAAKLEDYRLDFACWAERWRGAVATIVPEKGKHVWGAVWEIDVSNLQHLDRQESVHLGMYTPIEVEVTSLSGEVLKCRAYQLCKTPDRIAEGELIPEDRLPSKFYLDVIIQGAIESQLPQDYINDLKHIRHNPYRGEDSELKGQVLD